MKRTTAWLAWVGMVILALTLAVTLAPATPAHAAARKAATSGSLTLSITNGSSFQLDSNTGPHFSLSLQLSSAWTHLDSQTQATITLDSGKTLNPTFTLTAGVSQYTSGYNITLAIVPLPIGAHSAYATYSDPTNNNQLLTSNTVNFTVTPIYASLTCGVAPAGGVSTDQVWAPGQSLTLTVQSNTSDPNYPLDWTKGTATLTLKGPTTVTYSNIALDSSGSASLKAPTTLGYYAMNCAVTGVPYYTFSQTGYSSPTYLVSEQQALGGIKLYTNPTTIVAGTPIQMYIVFEAGSGLPTPTGLYTVYIGSGSQFYYTQSLKIASNGTASLSLAAIQNLYNAKSITVTYWGDKYYKQVSVNFPMTNPAIPGGTGGGTGGSGGVGTTPGQPTATPKPNTTATVGATPTAGSGSVGGASNPPAATPAPGSQPSVLGAFGPFSGGGLIVLLVIVVLLALGGGVGTFVLLSRRASAAPSASPGASRYPTEPHDTGWNVDTSPRLDTTQPDAPPWWRQDGDPYDGRR